MTTPPDFIDRDPTTIARQVKETYESALGKPLFPAQPEQLWINGAAYREILTRIAIQRAAEQNLVNYASGARLEQLGVLVGVTRLGAAKAEATIRVTRSGSLSTSLLVPNGTRFAPSNSNADLWFESIEDHTFEVNDNSIGLTVRALQNGPDPNGVEITEIIDVVTSTPLTVTTDNLPSGGAEGELDDSLRERIKIAPSQFSTAGSRDSYIFHTLTVDQSIIDVKVISPSPIQVNIYPLTESGLPSLELIDRIRLLVSDERVRPLTDDVRVEMPVTFDYQIQANVRLIADSNTIQITEDVTAAAEKYVSDKRKALGGDIVRSQIIAALHLEGVYDVELIEPANDVVLEPSQWPNASAVNIVVTGVEEG